MRRAGLALALLLPLAAATAARADERVVLSLRAGGMNRDDGGYADHAQSFGFGDPEAGFGGLLEGGLQILPRVWILGSVSSFSSSGLRRDSELTVRQWQAVAQLGFTALQHDFHVDGDEIEGDVRLRMDLVAGGGTYSIADELEGEGRSDRGPGLRAGTQLTVSWGAVGAILAYGYHATRVSIEDRVGGELRAGGHEFTAGVSVRF